MTSRQRVLCPTCGREADRYFNQMTESGVVRRERKYCQLDGTKLVVKEL